MTHFTNFCKPEKTFCGFRSDLVSYVKAVAFFSLKTTELQGLRVDNCGDSCEIGGGEAFRLLDVDKCVQSTLRVFCFAGKSILIQILYVLLTLEKNVSGLRVSASLKYYIVSIWLNSNAF